MGIMAYAFALFGNILLEIYVGEARHAFGGIILLLNVDAFGRSREFMFASLEMKLYLEFRFGCQGAGTEPGRLLSKRGGLSPSFRSCFPAGLHRFP